MVTNRIGALWLAADRAHLARLTHPGGPDPAAFHVTVLATGAMTHYFALLRSPPVQVTLLTRSVRQQWGLTRREREVVTWILRGATNREISSELGCAIKTVEHHVSSILRKAGVENRTGLIVSILDR